MKHFVSLFFFRFRQWCQRVIGHKMFDHVILLFIFLNCITIALERPDIQPNSMVAHKYANTHIHMFVIYTCKDPHMHNEFLQSLNPSLDHYNFI